MLNQFSKLVLPLPVIAVLLLSGCGGGRGTNADGGTITVNPNTVAYTAPSSVTDASLCTGANWTYTAFNIRVVDQAGRPVDASLSVVLDNSNATTGGGIAETMVLYDDPNWFSISSTPPTNQVGGTYVTNTGSGGTKRLIVGVDMTCVSAGTLYVSSDYGLYGQADLTVTAQ